MFPFPVSFSVLPFTSFKFDNFEPILVNLRFPILNDLTKLSEISFKFSICSIFENLYIFEIDLPINFIENFIENDLKISENLLNFFSEKEISFNEYYKIISFNKSENVFNNKFNFDNYKLLIRLDLFGNFYI